MAQSDAPTCFPFMRLPPDVQYNVCQSLCGHCGKQDPMAILYHSPFEQTKTLRNLVLTNRCMRSLAEGILYHFPRVFSYTDFFRTLHARPDLADSVKVLAWIYNDETAQESFSPFFERRDKTPREDIWYLRSLALELKLQDMDLVKFMQTFRDYPERANGDDHGAGVLATDVAFDNLTTSITMALCSRLEFLSVNVEDGRCEDRDWPEHKEPATFLYLPSLVKQRPEGFRFLRTLVLQNTLHHDPNTLGLERASFLWSLFPNAKCLIFFKARSEEHCYTDILLPENEPRLEYSWEALPHLNDLRFLRYSRHSRELPLPAITNLVSKCKELKTFSFSPGPWAQKTFSPSRLIQTISSTAVTLRQLTINCPIRNESSICAEQLVGPELMQFTQLESLILDQAVFCHHHHRPNSTQGAGCLTDILPQSVQHLTVNMNAPFGPLVDLVALGAAVSRGSFPNLVQLRIQIMFEDKREPETDSPFTLRANGNTVPTLVLQSSSQLNQSILKPPSQSHRRQILDAFDGTKVALEIDCFRHDNFSTIEFLMQPPTPPRWCDAKRIDDERLIDELLEG